MSEAKSRTIEQVQEEYNKGCFRAGHVQYNITVLTQELALLNDTLRDLNVEAAKIKQAQIAAVPAPAAEGSAS